MPKFPGRLVTTTGLVAALWVSTASASSDDAWEEFRAEVNKACMAAAEGTFEKPAIVVDPFGSESYGIAVLSGLERGGDKTPRTAVCVFSKTSKKAELGSVLELK